MPSNNIEINGIALELHNPRRYLEALLHAKTTVSFYSANLRKAVVAALGRLPPAKTSTERDAMMRILRDNADLTQQLRATQTQMAQDNALVAEQLKALTEMMARGNEKPQHRRRRRR